MTDTTAPILTPDLVRRIGITLVALLLYRVGQWTPLPGIDLVALGRSTVTNAFPPPRAIASVMALGIAPLLTALIFAEALKCFSPRIRRWADAPDGKVMFWRGTVIAALLLATLQARGIAAALETMPSVVIEPGIPFKLGVAASFVGATMFVVLLAAWITRHGVGHGIWVLFAAGLAEKFFQPLIVQLPLLAIGAETPQGFMANATAGILVLALAAAAVTALVKASPQLSTPPELIWSPLVAGAVVSLLLTALLLPIVLAAPESAAFVSTAAFNLNLPLVALATAAIVLARRKSLLPPEERVNVAAAVPAIALLAAFVIADLVIPMAKTALLLSAVGVLLLMSNRSATDTVSAAPLAR